MKCAYCGVVVPDAKVTFAGRPICIKCVQKGFAVFKTNTQKPSNAGDETKQ